MWGNEGPAAPRAARPAARWWAAVAVLACGCVVVVVAGAVGRGTGLAVTAPMHGVRVSRTPPPPPPQASRTVALPKQAPEDTTELQEPLEQEVPEVTRVLMEGHARLTKAVLAAMAVLLAVSGLALQRRLGSVEEEASFVTAAVVGDEEAVLPAAEEPLSPRVYPEVDLRGSLPIVILPGLGNCTEDYDSLKAALLRRGAPRVEVLPVTRPDWLRNAAGLADPAYWKGELEPRPVLDWYLDRIDAVLEAVKEDVTLIGHSAGGWLARVYLGPALDHPNQQRVKRLVTLGTPHLPAAPESGAPDQTRGLLNYITREYPGAFHPEIEYVSVAGKHRKGAFFWEDPAQDPDCNGTRFEKFIVGAGYWTVCGTLEVWGDSIVPVQSAVLPASKAIVLQGVYHSPLGDEARAREWYGSEDNIDKWAEALV
eukprot:EG_transcript_9178